MIYVFGDSFSVKFGDRRFISNLQDYINWKGYDPKLYFELLSDDLGEEYECYVKPGMSNTYIFNQFINVYDKIKPTDIIIFNWTEIVRFIYYQDDKVRSSLSKDFNEVFSEQTFNEILLNRTNQNYIKEQYDLINFIDKILKDNKVIHWTWASNKEIPQDNQFTIQKETDGLIYDFHFGESGHRYLYECFSKLLKEKNKIHFNLWEI